MGLGAVFFVSLDHIYNLENKSHKTNEHTY